MKRLICFILSFQISGFTSFFLCVHSAAAEETPASSLHNNFIELKDRVHGLSLRLRMPGIKGTPPGGVPSVREMDEVEKDFSQLLLDFEHEFDLAAEKINKKQPAAFPLSDLTQLLLFYRDILAELVIVKLGLPESSKRGLGLYDYTERFTISIPFTIARILQMIELPMPDRFGNEIKTLDFDWSQAIKKGRVTAKLSSPFIDGLDASQVFEKSINAESLFGLVQLLTIKQEMKVLKAVRERLGKRTNELPSMDPAFVAKFQALRLWDLLIKEESENTLDAQIRFILGEEFAKIRTKLPSFGPNDYIKKIAHMTAPELGKKSLAAVESTIKNQLSKAEELNLTTMFENLILTTNWNFAGMSDEVLASILKDRIAKTFVNIHVGKRVFEEPSLQMGPAPSLNASPKEMAKFANDQAAVAKRAVELSQFIKNQAAAYEAKLDTQMILDLVAQTRARAQQNLQSSPKEFTDNLLNSVRRYSQGIKGQRVDMKILTLSLKNQIHNLQLDPTRAQKGLDKIRDAIDYPAARAYYHAQALSLLGPEVMNGDVADPVKMAAKIETAFKNQIDLSIAPRGQDSKYFMQDRLQKNAANWLAIGKLFNFFEDFSRARAVLSPYDVLHNDPTTLAIYKLFLDDNAVRSQGLLTLDIPQDKSSRKFFEVIEETQKNPAQLQAAIRVGLKLQEQKTLANIKACSQWSADKPEGIEVLLKTSMMNQLLLSAYPEFEMPRAQFLQKLTSMGPVELMVKKYLDPFMDSVQYGFLATWILGIYTAARLARSTKTFVPKSVLLVEPIVSSLSQFLKGFFIPLIGVQVAGLAYEIRDMQNTGKNLAAAQNLADTSFEGLSFIDESELMAFQSLSDEAKSKFYLDSAIILSIGLFMGKSYLNHKNLINVESSINRSKEAFDRLGLDRWNWAPRKIEQAYQASVARNLNNVEHLKQLQADYEFLLNEIKLGHALRPQVFFNFDMKDMTPWEKQTLKFLREMHKAYRYQFYQRDIR